MFSQSTSPKDDVASFRNLLEFFLCHLSCCVPLRRGTIGMIAESHLSVSLPHLFVCGSFGNPQCAISLLKRDINVWLPRFLLLLIASKIVRRTMLEGKMDSRASVHRVDEPAEQEAEEEPFSATYI